MAIPVSKSPLIAYFHSHFSDEILKSRMNQILYDAVDDLEIRLDSDATLPVVQFTR